MAKNKRVKPSETQYHIKHIRVYPCKSGAYRFVLWGSLPGHSDAQTNIGEDGLEYINPAAAMQGAEIYISANPERFKGF